MALTDAALRWPPGNGEMARLIRAHDWAATALGSLETWPERLRVAVELALESPQVASLAMGPERLLLYNDVAARLFGVRHPAELGRPLAEAFLENYPDLVDFYDQAFAGAAVAVPACPVVPGKTDGEVFEATLQPVRSETGDVLAVLMIGNEVSGRWHAEARLREWEARYRAFVTASSDVVYRISPDWREMRALEGQGFLADTPEAKADWMEQYIAPEDRPVVEAAIATAVRSKSLFDLEHRVILADGSLGWTHFRAAPVLDKAGEIVEWLGAAKDVTARRQAEERLRQSETRLHNVLYGMDEAFGLMDQDFRILSFNDSALRLESRPLEEIRGRTHWEVYPGSEHSEVGHLLKKALVEQQPVTLEHLYTWESGQARRLEMRAYPVPEGLAVFWRDISERKVAEQQLRDSEEKYRSLFNTMGQGYCELELVRDAEGRAVDQHYIELNPAFERLIGIPVAAAKGRKASEVLPALEPWWTRAFDRIARQGKPERIEHEIAALGRWYEVYTYPRGGDRLVLLYEDITERKHAEAALHDSEARQAFLLTLGDALRGQTSTSGLIETAARLLGEHLNASRIMFAEFNEARGVADIFHGWFADGAEPFPTVMRLEDYEGPILEDLRAGRTVRIEDTRDPALARPDLTAIAELGVSALLSVPLVVGGKLVVNLSVHQHAARPWTDAEVALVHEVAERLWADLVRARAEEALRTSEARLSEAFRIQTVGVMFWSKDFELTDMNEAFLRMSGFTREEALGKTWAELTPPEFHEVSHRAIEEVLTRGETTPHEKQYIRKDGSRWWGLFAARRVGEEVVEFVLDMTERHGADERLRDSEERFRTIVETARDHAIFTTDVEGRIETWPAGAQAVFGWSAEEAVGQPVAITFTPEDRAKDVPEKERSEAREKGHAADVRWHLRKDGARVFIEGVTRPLTGSDGTLTGYLKVGQDVTARRATEAALQESEARFRQFGEASADVLWIRDCASLAFEYVSPAFETVYGTKIEDVLGGNHVFRWVEMILPEDREKTLEAIRRVRGGETVLHSLRVLHGDGQIRSIRNTDFPLVDAEGRVQRIGGIAHDATDEVEMRNRLQVLVAELQHRSRNLVGVTQAITERTLATSETLAEFRGRFRPRLDALGRVNGLLSRLEEGDRITFDQLLQTELAAHGILGGEDNGTAISLQGPKGIRLRSATVQTFALALHELTTNALKYGALAGSGGRLQVTWRLVPGKGAEQRLRVDWSETKVPAVDGKASREHLLDGQPVASRRGYGRELIELALPYQLKAETSYELTAEGVRCTIIVPVSTTLDVAFSSQEDPHD